MQLINLKFCWNLIHSQQSWVNILSNSVLRNGKPIQHQIHSSLWSGIKEEFNVITNNSAWLLGNGNAINFWIDAWCRAPYLRSSIIHSSSMT